MDKSRRWLDPEMQPRYRDGTLVNPDNPWLNPDNPAIVSMPIPRGICNGTTLQWKVELLEHPLRSYSTKVFKTVKVIKNDTVTDVKVNRRCLFAFDVQMDFVGELGCCKLRGGETPARARHASPTVGTAAMRSRRLRFPASKQVMAGAGSSSRNLQGARLLTKHGFAIQ